MKSLYKGKITKGNPYQYNHGGTMNQAIRQSEKMQASQLIVKQAIKTNGQMEKLYMQVETAYISCQCKVSAPMRTDGVRVRQWREHGDASAIDVPIPDISSTPAEKEK